jgi:hypothetical protein
VSGTKLDVRGIISSGATYGGVYSIYDTLTSTQVGYFSTDAQAIANNDTNVAIVAAQSGKGIKFYTSGVNERARIDSSGNVGIGTTSPTNILNVATASTGKVEVLRLQSLNGFASGAGTFVRAGSGGVNSILFGFDYDSSSFQIQNGNTSVALMSVLNSGNVGIGTSSPITALHVVSTGTPVTAGPGNGGIYIQNNGATGYDAAAYIIAGQSGNARINCGYSTGGSNTSVVAQFFSDNGSTRACVVAGGSGGVYLSSGGTSWNTLSDERFKDIIEPITNASASLKNWRTVIGKYKTDADGVRRVFFIAQDIQKTTPEAIDSTKEEELGLRYSDTIPVVTAAVNEHTDEITSLKNIIETLKSRLDAANL